MRHPFTTPLKGLDGFFDDPARSEQFQAILRSFQRQVEEGFTRVSSASNIGLALPESFSGQEDIEVSLQEFLASLETQSATQLIPKGVIVAFEGTWAEAEALQGWDICDGRGDTPDLLDAYVKWVADKQDAKTKGGATTHTHDDHTAQQVVDAIADHANHRHAVDIETGVSSVNLGIENVEGSHDAVAHWTHLHDVVGNTGLAGGEGHDPTDDSDLEHSVESNDPPFVTLIPIMKT